MRGCTIKYSLCSIILTLSFLFLSSCASFGPTKPNPVFQGPYPAKYYELAEKNPLLAQELGKLPELQDGIFDSEASALEKIVELYNADPSGFTDAFEQMYQVGKPEVRKYCSPLQALFWLVESDRRDDAKGILKHYSLEELLRTAWPSKKSVLTEYQILDIIGGIKNEHDRKDYEEWYSKIDNSKKLWSSLLTDYLVEPKNFSERGQRILAKLMKPPEPFKEEEWEDFDTVADRLNAPELLHYYMRDNFHYEAYTGLGGGARGIFKRKWGNCCDHEDFQSYCLRKAGYKTRSLTVWSISGWCTGHRVTLFHDKGKIYFMDNGRLRGPYQSMLDAPYDLRY
jgi:hypothetical protein